VKTVRIRIGGKMFVLGEHQDFDKLKRDIVAAARSGADFVAFETAEGISVSALISPHVVVRMWEIEQPADTSAQGAHSFVTEHTVPEHAEGHFES
jgi:hypothetical protein